MSGSSANDNKQIRVLLSELIIDFSNLNRHIVEAYSLMEHTQDKKELLKKVIRDIEISDAAVQQDLKKIKKLLYS